MPEVEERDYFKLLRGEIEQQAADLVRVERGQNASLQARLLRVICPFFARPQRVLRRVPR